ncbi:MAG: HNH endonuclease [Armatimonadetes bacterium]|nr:HNH endonuclease [Armatimonadota bacterium]
MRVLVLDKDQCPLDPCHPARARQLLRAGRAAIWRRQPLIIILRDREAATSVTHSHRLKIDPGSRITGLALVQEETGRVVWAAELTHRSQAIHQKLLDRRALRRARRTRKTRYRAPRFLNRKRPDGWLAPSLASRVAHVTTWVARLRRWAPVRALSLELVKFDTHKLQNPEVVGVEYQQGELFGYEVREYLLEKFGHRCAYCDGRSGDPILEVEHIIPKTRGGSDRVSNLTIACQKCNQKKGNRTAAEFGHPEVQARAKAPLKDAAAVNAMRWALRRNLDATGLPLECGSGGRTKFNRTRAGLAKAHWSDAACVGASTPEWLQVERGRALGVRATGHGRRQRCRTDKFGFPVAHAERRKKYQYLGISYQTGDLVKAIVPNGKMAGRQVGRVTIRFRPSFQLNGGDVHPKYLTRLQRADGYEYSRAA